MNYQLFAFSDLSTLPVAKMSGVELAGKIDREIKRLIKLSECTEDRRVMVRGEDGKRYQVTMTAEQIREAASTAFDEYLTTQQDIFASKGLERSRAFKEAIVTTGEITKTGNPIYRIVPRKNPIVETIDRHEGDTKGLNLLTQLPSEKLRPETRKTEAALLIDQTTASVDPTEAWNEFDYEE